MDELARRPDDPDAIDPEPSGTPDPDSPDPGRDRAADEDRMRFPGAEEAPDVIGAGTDFDRGEGPEAPDATGSTDES